MSPRWITTSGFCSPSCASTRLAGAAPVPQSPIRPILAFDLMVMTFGPTALGLM